MASRLCGVMCGDFPDVAQSVRSGIDLAANKVDPERWSSRRRPAFSEGARRFHGRRLHMRLHALALATLVAFAGSAIAQTAATPADQVRTDKAQIKQDKEKLKADRKAGDQQAVAADRQQIKSDKAKLKADRKAARQSKKQAGEARPEAAKGASPQGRWPRVIFA